MTKLQRVVLSPQVRRYLFCFLGLLILFWFLREKILPQRTSEKLTLSFISWGGLEEVNMNLGLLAEFEKAHPGIHVEFIHAANYNDKLKTMMAAGTSPDVMYIDVGSYAAYAEQGVLLDLEPFLNDIDLSDFFPLLVEAFRYKGKLYGLPKDCSTYMLYYNQDLFDAAGLAYPDSTWTWEDVRRAALLLTRDFEGDGRIDQFGFYSWEVIPGWLNYIWQNGGWVLSPDDKRCLIDRPEAIEALEFLADLKFKDQVIPSGITAGGQNPAQLFLTGRLATGRCRCSGGSAASAGMCRYCQKGGGGPPSSLRWPMPSPPNPPIPGKPGP